MLACPQHPWRQTYGESGKCFPCLRQGLKTQDDEDLDVPKGRPAGPGDCTPEVSAYDLFLVELARVNFSDLK